MNIGQAAKSSGVSAKMIRYYEQTGLIPPADRKASGYRDYSDRDVHMLRFIRRAQRLGFTLEEIAQLLALDALRDRERARALAESKVADLEARIADLRAMRRVLVERIAHCVHGRPAEPCPILDAFGGDVGVEPLEEG